MTENIYAKRLARVRDQFEEWGVDGLLIGSPSNRRWLSGFTGSAGWLIVSPDNAVLATDFRYWEQAEDEAPAFQLHRLPRTSRALEEFILAHGAARLGVEAAQLTLSDYRRLRKLDDIEWLPLDATLEPLREVKSAGEIAVIRRAAAITDLAMAQVPALARPGLTEADLAWELEKRMREAGADDMAFPVKVAGGPNAARPHHSPGPRPLQIGDSIIVDMGAAVEGYRSDLTRSFHLGGAPDEKFWRVYNLTLAAQANALQNMRAGMSGQAIDALARDVISAGGHGDDFGHSLGHGVGLEIHEGPRLSRIATEAIPAGAAITVEPGIYLPGWGGIRIEDLILLTEAGVEMISACPKQPIIEVGSRK